MFYSLEYSLADPNGQLHRFGTIVEGTPDTIAAVMEARNIGETGHREFTPSSNPPDDRSLADLIQAEGCTPGTLHMACFVGFLALKSGAAGVDEVLGDTGLIHEIAHHLHFGEDEPCLARLEEIAGMAHRIEQAIPGYPYRPVTPRL